MTRPNELRAGSRHRIAWRRTRLSALVLTTSATVMLAFGLLPGAAAVVEETTAEETEWISKDGGVAGRETPAISADGRYVAYVARSVPIKGIWVKDRAAPDTPPVAVALGDLMNPDISGDGSVVAWAAYGTPRLVYALEWQKPGAGAEIVSIGDDGQTPTSADFPSLNADGSIVAFQAMSRTLDAEAPPAGTGGGPQTLYVRDRANGETTVVSVLDDESQIAAGNAVLADITPDGRYVVFASDAGNLAEGSTTVLAAPGEEEEEDTVQQLYRRDLVAGTTTMVSVNSAGEPGDLGSALNGYGPTISADGTLIAFDSDATNLVADDTNGDSDAFLRNLTAGTTVRISLDESGDQVDLPTDEIVVLAPPEDGEEDVDLTPNVGAGPAVSANGLFVAFESMAALTADDLNSGPPEEPCQGANDPVPISADVDVPDVYSYDVTTGTIARKSLVGTDADPTDEYVPVEATGYRIDGMTQTCTPVSNGVDAAITADGRRVVFVSNGNLTGDRVVSEEESVEETETEPAVFLRRPDPEPDTFAPVSAAFAPAAVTQPAFTVGYTAVDLGLLASGVQTVDLWVRVPGGTAFTLAGTDTLIDGSFAYTAAGDGQYAFYTVATDVSGNVEGAPATPDALTLVNTYVPPAGGGGGGGVETPEPSLIAPTPGPFLPPATITARGKACTIVGTAGKDVLRGTTGKDVICGLAGDDVIYGYAGADIIVGGPGNDRLYGGAHNDVVDGGLGNDLVDGGTGKDVLYGGAGNDILQHRLGSERMYGGTGNDRFSAKDRDVDWLNGGLGRDTALLDKRIDRFYSMEVVR